MSSKENKRTARDQLRDERQRQAAADRRKRNITNTVIAVVVVSAILVIFVLVQNSRTSSSVTNAALPDLVSSQGGGMTFGDGPVKVDLWEDFQCPICKQFEATSGAMLAKKVQDGSITLVIHPLSFLDTNNSNTSSALAANAFGCSAAAGQTTALNFHSKVYQNQPPENPGTPAWSASDLIGWGNDVGVTGSAWESCVNDSTYADWVDQVAKSQVNVGVHGTPTAFVDGKQVDVNTIEAAITAAGSGSSTP